MVELGLYGIARVYWSMFGQALGHRAAITAPFLALGVLTAVVGALFCFRERHIKRLLAFSTISHAGMFLAGIALLTPLGLAGAAVYVVGHALVKAALFLCIGHRACTVSARSTRPGCMAGAASCASPAWSSRWPPSGWPTCPPFATFLGKGWIAASGRAHGLAWITGVFVVCSVLVGGAVLRVAGGVFYGLGDPPSEDPQMAEEAAEETSETDSGKQRTPLSMIVPAGRARRLRRRRSACSRSSARWSRRRRCGSRTRPATTPPCWPVRTSPTRPLRPRPSPPGSPWPTC